MLHVFAVDLQAIPSISVREYVPHTMIDLCEMETLTPCWLPAIINIVHWLGVAFRKYSSWTLNFTSFYVFTNRGDPSATLVPVSDTAHMFTMPFLP